MATKEEIKDSAYYCFAHYGYEGTTMKDIAKAVGLKKQSLYSHFGSKEELYLTILQEEQKQITAEMTAAYLQLKDKPVEALLLGFFESCISIFSVKERLLLWKRTFIYFGSDQKIFDKDIPDWHFNNALRDVLYADLKSSYTALADVDAFKSFFISYMLMVQGYLDWMMVMGHDKASLLKIWTNFWDGTKNFFLA